MRSAVETGRTAARYGPMYGRYRNMAPRKPQSNAYFTPRARRPDAQHEPERAVDERLHEQETADPLARLIDELRGGRDAARSPRA